MKKNLLLLVLLIGYFKIANAQILDLSFGVGGIVKTDMGLLFNYNISGKQVLVQPGGSIYIIVEAQAGTLVIKKRADGSTDSSYGNNGFSTPLPIKQSHGALEPDGRIVIAGSVANSSGSSANQTDYAIGRINTDGSIDGTFGNAINITDLGITETFNAVTIQPDGKILCAGYGVGSQGQSQEMVIVRYNINGSVDGTFSEDQILIAKLAGAYSIALQADKKIIIGGFTKTDIYSNTIPAIIRLNSNGSLDSGFNGTGVKSIDPTGKGGPFSAVAVQSDNKIIAALGVTMLRLNEAGSVDSTYGINGIQTFNFGGTSKLNSIALQSDGKLVVGGYTLNGSNYDFAVARYSTDGTPDASFNGNGKLTTDFGSSNDYINSIAIQNDGKILAVGYLINSVNNSYSTMARYNTDGTSDGSLNGSGLVTDIIKQGNTQYTSTALQIDGKIVAAGYTWTGSKYEFALARYNINGTLDNTFSNNGEQFKTFDSTSNDKIVAIAIQPDGKIVVTGSAGDSIIIARYNKDGNPDGSFNGNGFVIMDSGLPDYVASLALQSDGKILIGGKNAVLRYNSNGTTDTGFGINGKIATRFSYYNTAFNCNAIALQGDGKIIIVANGATAQFIIGRYYSNGVTDSSFGTNGETAVFNFNISGKAVGIQSDGKIIVGGYQEEVLMHLATTSTFAVDRFNTDGTLDNTFGDNGIVFTTIGPSRAYSTSLLIQNDNKIILGGYSYNNGNNNFTIARYNTNGSLDNTFGTQGVLITAASSLDNRIYGLALGGDYFYAAGYGQYPGNLGVVTKYILAASGPLPVTLFSFKAHLENNSSVLLNWTTASEHNLSNFIVERSADGINFLSIGNVMANGNSPIKLNYSSLDEQPTAGNNFYRLKMIDVDGKYTYSNIVSVNIVSQFTWKISPNPASNILLIQANGNNEAATFQIVDMIGRKQKLLKVVLNGNAAFSIDINNLSKGIYNIVLIKNNKMETQKFIKE